MNKKGVSPLIATVLIIGFTIVLAAVVMQWGGSFVRSLTETTATSSELQIKCMEIDFDIANVVTTTPQSITLVNNKDIEIAAFLIQTISTTGDTSNLVGGDVSGNNLPAFESKPISLTGLVTGDKIRVIPYVKLANNDIKGCSADTAQEYTVS